MNDISDDLKHEIENKEASLWKAETRNSKYYMQSILHSEFIEIGRSGKSHTRKECIKAAIYEFKSKLPLPNFECFRIDTNTIQTTYISDIQVDGARELGRRSSLWLQENGEWKLRFHQGTVLE